MTQPEIDAALALPSDCLREAQRVFGSDASVRFDLRCAEAGATLDNEDDAVANEIRIWGERPLERLLACLRALPGST